MEVKIGVKDVARELVLESDQTPEQVVAALEEALASGGMLRLTDERGRAVVVPATSVGYLEIGAPSARSVGFGAL